MWKTSGMSAWTLALTGRVCWTTRRSTSVKTLDVALFCRPEGAETGKPRRGEPRLRGRPWGSSVRDGGLDVTAKRPLGPAQAGIGTIGQDLVAFQLGFLFVRRVNDRPTPRVDLPGQVLGPGNRMSEQLDQHLDDVFEGVILVVENHDVIRRDTPGSGLLRDFGLDDGADRLIVTRHCSNSW